MRLLLLVSCWLCLCPITSRAASLRELTQSASLVVLATPTDPITPLRFRVTAVLRGPAQVGQELAPTNLQAEVARTFHPPGPSEVKPRPRLVDTALLFLGRDGDNWKILPGGLRFNTVEGLTLALSSDGRTLELAAEVRWPVLVQQIRRDLASLEQLELARRLPRPSRRVEALLDWIQAHQSDFQAATTGTEEKPIGWGRLQYDIFQWVFAIANLPQAWRTVVLYAELNNGELPRCPIPALASVSGRAYLLQTALDTSRLRGDRLRALQLLTRPDILQPSRSDPTGLAEPLGPKEQQVAIDRLIRLLEDASEEIRVEAIRTLVVWSQQGAQASGRGLSALVARYKDSKQEQLRNELALALATLAPAATWKELSGNPPGVVAILRDVERQDSQLTFWLEARLGGATLRQAPTLVLEKLGALGFITETRRFTPSALNLPQGWEAGWTAAVPLAMQVDLDKLEPGTLYRVRLEGVLGQQQQKWTSEMIRFNVPAKANPDAPQQSKVPGIRLFR